MLDWIRRIRKVTQTLSLPSRDTSAGRSQGQLNASKVIPATEVFLANLLQTQLLIADLLEDDATPAPKKEWADGESKLADSYRARSVELKELLLKQGSTHIELQQQVRDRLDELVQRTEGNNWFEDLLRTYLVFGLLEDSYLRIAKGLSPARRLRVEAMLSDNSLLDFCQDVLTAAIAENSGLADELALFGRAIIADALLEVRDSLDFSKLIENPPADQAELTREQFRIIEPLTTELISAHTLRMDSLGLTA